MSKDSPLYDTVNFAVTDRMTKLERKPIGNRLDKCLEHFFPTHRPLVIGYKPLSLTILSGLFVIVVVCLLVASLAFIIEWFWARCKRTNSPIKPRDVYSKQDTIDYIRRVSREFNLNRITVTDGVIICYTFCD